MGIALDHIAQPGRFADRTLSHRMRDAVFGQVLTGPDARDSTDERPVRTAALQLRARLDLGGTDALEPEETALLTRWLERISTSDQS
ncbi:hypothetical protein ACU686_14045 [Yinghuangia aomiensis]